MVSTSDINEDYLTFLLNQTALSKQEACNYLIANDGNLTLAVQKFITDFPQLNLYRSKYNTLGP
jgi:NACalpha-BTF3-like transcription factor